MDPPRKRSLQVALGHIDRHRGIYASVDEQNEMLENLINKHDLKYKARANDNVTDLNVSKFRGAIEYLAYHYCLGRGEESRITRVYLHGSRVLTSEILTRMGYAESLDVSDAEESEDESFVSFVSARKRKSSSMLFPEDSTVNETKRIAVRHSTREESVAPSPRSPLVSSLSTVLSSEQGSTSGTERSITDTRRAEENDQP